MAYTLAQQLDSVQAAIAAIESGAQEVSVNNRTYRKADLKTLYDREERLLARISRETNGDMKTVAEF